MNKFQHATQSDVLDDIAFTDIALKDIALKGSTQRGSLKTSSQTAGGGAVGVAEPEVEAIDAADSEAEGFDVAGLGLERFEAERLEAIALGSVSLGNSRVADAPEADAAEIDADEFDADEFVVDDFGATEFDADEFTAEELNAAHFDAALRRDEFDSAEFESAEFDGAEFESAEFDSAEFDSAEFDSAEFDSAEFDVNGRSAQNVTADLDDAIDLDDAMDPDDAVDAVGEVMEVEVIDAQDRDRSYEVYQEGSLTYFRYYLDDEEDGGFYDHEAIASPRPFLSAGAMGVGVLAVTFGVGLLVAEATNRRAQNRIKTDIADASQQPIGSKRVTTQVKGDPAFPESLKPDWSSADKAFGKSVTAKSGKESLLAKSTSAEDKVSLAAAKLKGDATQIAAASAAKPGTSASTWNSSAAATPYIPPAMAVMPIVTPNYQVVASGKLSPAPIPKLTAAPVQATGLVSAEQRQLAMRIEAMRKASNGQAAQSAQQTLQTSSGLAQAATDSVWLPNPDRRTYVTDPVRPAAGELVTPAAGAYAASSQVRKGGAEGNGTTDNAVAAAPTQPSLLDAPSGAVSNDALQRAELQKQLMNQAIAKPVSGLLVVPVSAPASGAEVIPLDAVPSTSSFMQRQLPSGEAEDELLLEAQVPSDGFTVAVIPAGVEGQTAVQSLQELMAGASSAAQSSSASPQTLPQALPRPLTQGVAQEAVRASDQLSRFRVLSLNPADYNQLWRMSANSSDRLMAPVYGFVDYQRSVIAVVQGNSVSNGVSTGVAARIAPAVERSDVQQLAQALTPAAGELSRR